MKLNIYEYDMKQRQQQSHTVTSNKLFAIFSKSKYMYLV
jgi:hypothetical protein